MIKGSYKPIYSTPEEERLWEDIKSGKGIPPIVGTEEQYDYIEEEKLWKSIKSGKGASHLNIPLQKSVPPMSKKKIINRNVITDIIYSHFGYCRESALQNAIDEIIDYFNDISVDKQKIVRCKNCIHGKLEEDGDYLCTNTGCTWNEKDFYCKNGE